MSVGSQVLIVGFSAFPGAPRNPTEDLALALADERPTCVLPVSWERSWPELEARIVALKPRTVLLFGLSMRTERLRIERLARNRRELGLEDAFGAFPAGPGVGEGPETLPGCLPWGACAAALRRVGVDFEWSNNAGGYLCNQTYFRLAHAAPDLGVERFGFFHVPPTDAMVESFDPVSAPPVHCSMPAEALAAAARALCTVAGGGRAGDEVPKA